MNVHIYIFTNIYIYMNKGFLIAMFDYKRVYRLNEKLKNHFGK